MNTRITYTLRLSYAVTKLCGRIMEKELKMTVHDKRIGNWLQPSTCGTKSNTSNGVTMQFVLKSNHLLVTLM